MSEAHEDPVALAVVNRGMLPVADVVARVRRIQEIMNTVMIGPDAKTGRDGIHYGVIPGTLKPTLYQPGAELLCTTFRIAPRPAVEDLSTRDGVRYRVIMRAEHQTTGEMLGEGVGECSSDETKYRWCRPVCDQEWQETPVDQRREKWMHGKNNTTYKAKQVCTSPADIANTILKMAYKRALISMTRVVLACSDIFAQDLEDLPEEVRDAVIGETSPAIREVQRKGDAPKAETKAPPPATTGGARISEPQRKRFYALAKSAGWKDDELKAWLHATYGLDHTTDIPVSQYDHIIAAVQQGATMPSAGQALVDALDGKASTPASPPEPVAAGYAPDVAYHLTKVHQPNPAQAYHVLETSEGVTLHSWSATVISGAKAALAACIPVRLVAEPVEWAVAPWRVVKLEPVEGREPGSDDE
jgi:hypothetical protein